MAIVMPGGSETARVAAWIAGAAYVSRWQPLRNSRSASSGKIARPRSRWIVSWSSRNCIHAAVARYHARTIASRSGAGFSNAGGLT